MIDLSKYYSYEYCVMKDKNNIECFSSGVVAEAYAESHDADYVLLVGYDKYENEQLCETVWENQVRENIVRERLNLVDSPEWDKWKNDIMKTIRDNQHYLKFFDYGYCLESNLDFERNFYLDCGYKLDVIKNCNGLLIYHRVKL